MLKRLDSLENIILMIDCFLYSIVEGYAIRLLFTVS